MSKFGKFFDLEKFPLDLAFNIRGHRENTPYSSSEPNESDIVNRQSGGKKLKYICLLKFYEGDTCHVILRMRNDVYSIVPMGTWCLGHSILKTAGDTDLVQMDHQ